MASMIVVRAANRTRCVKKCFSGEKKKQQLSSVWVSFGPWKTCNFRKRDTNCTKCIGKSAVLFQKALGKGECSAWGHMHLSVYVNAVFSHSDAVLDSLIEWVRRSDLFSVICTCVRLLPPTAAPEETDICPCHYSDYLD